VDGLHAHDRVYAYDPEGGFHAEYVSVRKTRVARVPPQVPQSVAGAIPRAALTALVGLTTLHVARERTLLVLGARDGVGSLAVFLAAALHAVVIAGVRPDVDAYVRSLGATETVNPYSQRRDAKLMRVAPHGIDAAFVTGEVEMLEAFAYHLRRGAPLVYPQGLEPEPLLARHPLAAVHPESWRDALAQVNALIGSRDVPLDVTAFPIERVAEAERRARHADFVGEVVLQIR
jgi:NADPH:quinone reductase-like Zn-dependent oxidoreductase